MHDLPTGTVTFLFTDIEGSTRLVQRLGERYAGVLEEHQHILRGIFEEAGGHEIDTQGDAFFIAFSRAKDAATAALAAQSALLAHEWPDGERVRVRMGLHTAEPLVDKEPMSAWACIGQRASAPLGTAAKSCCRQSRENWWPTTWR
jgi:class 3 adenylate cyclase